MAAPTIATLIETYTPVVAQSGLNTLKNINFNSGSNTCDLPLSTTINGVAVAGIGNISSSSTTATAFSVTNTGVFVTGSNHVVSFVADSATTGTLFSLSANGLTTGHGIAIASSGVIATTGDLLSVIASGATTSTGVVRITTAALTTGTALAMNADGLTTGLIASFKSNSADTTARNLVLIHNDNSAAVGAVPLIITQDAVVATKFKAIAKFGGATIYFDTDNTEPDGALTGVKGDICLNAVGGFLAICDADGTNWTTLS